VTKGKRFKTMKAGQQTVAINVIEGGDSSGKNATSIGRCVIRDLPPGLPEGTPVDVLFTYGENGRLAVRGRLPDLKRETRLDIERTSGLNDAKLLQWDQRLRSGLGVG
jgi:molecular chaperone DnaK